MRRCVTGGLLLLGLGSAAAAGPGSDYALRAERVADGVYVFAGRQEHFTRDNGGNIANTGFIAGPQGVTVIDTGPSQRYGEQMRAAIAATSPAPIARVVITHAHPDHFLGNQAYADVPIAALPATIDAIHRNGDALSSNLYRLVGGWMAGTQPVTPGQVAAPGETTVGGRRLRLIAGAGHTGADLMVFDVATATLFAGDLVFFERAPTTPDADVRRWLATLDEMDRIDFKVLVPGHGPVVRDHAAIAQTRDYLRWLAASLKAAAAQGLDMTEVMTQPLPERFRTLAVVQPEYTRSVTHLYPKIELDTLPLTGGKEE